MIFLCNSFCKFADLANMAKFHANLCKTCNLSRSYIVYIDPLIYDTVLQNNKINK